MDSLCSDIFLTFLFSAFCTNYMILGVSFNSSIGYWATISSPCINIRYWSLVIDIHTVGPIWRGGNQDEEKFLAECYSNSLQIAVDQGIRSVAFPSISTGAYSFPKEKAAMIAVRTVNDFIEENSGSLDLVEWILFDEETLNIYKDALNQFKANKIVGTPGF